MHVEDGIRDDLVTGVQTCALPISQAVLGLRDILDARAAVLKEWSADHIQERIADYYDLVLVYGARAVFDSIEEYQFPQALAERTKRSEERRVGKECRCRWWNACRRRHTR